MEMAGIREAPAGTITNVLTRGKEKEVRKQVLRATDQQKEGLDSKEQASEHSTGIQGQSHHPDNIIQAPYFDLQALHCQANLTQCQPLFSLYGLPERPSFIPLSMSSSFPKKDLGTVYSFCLEYHFTSSSYGCLPLILYLGLSSNISSSSLATPPPFSITVPSILPSQYSASYNCICWPEHCPSPPLAS